MAWARYFPNFFSFFLSSRVSLGAECGKLTAHVLPSCQRICFVESCPLHFFPLPFWQHSQWCTYTNIFWLPWCKSPRWGHTTVLLRWSINSMQKGGLLVLLLGYFNCTVTFQTLTASFFLSFCRRLDMDECLKLMWHGITMYDSVISVVRSTR